MLLRLNWYDNINFQSQYGIFFWITRKYDSFRKLVLNAKLITKEQKFYVVHYAGPHAKFFLKHQIKKILFAFKHKWYKKFVKNVDWKQIG